MKTLFSTTMIGISLALMCTSFCTAQNLLGKRDSLPVLKPSQLVKQYQVKHQGENEYSISARKPKRAEVVPNRVMGNFLGGAITMFTGINTGSTTTSLWMMQGELTCQGNLPSWKMPLYFQGTFVKDRERVTDNDGNTSVELVKALSVDWDQESYGFIYEGRDTIGYFKLMTNLWDDSTSLRWLPALALEGSKVVKKSKVIHVPGKDFKVVLAFRGRSFTILSQSEYFRTLILIDGKPAATFQSDQDYVVLKKSNRTKPYILFAEGTSDADKADLIRLSILSVLLRNITSEDMHEM